VPYKNNYPKKKINEIDPDVDYKVKVIGLIVDKKEDTIVIDDGESKVRVFVDSDIFEKIGIHQLVAVFGSTLPSDRGFDIKADVIQDLTGLDLNLYKKVDELYKKLGV